MYHIIQELIPPADLPGILAGIERMEFQDGLATAGEAAAQVKRNEQHSEDPEGVAERIQKTVLADARFRTLAMPRRQMPFIISRYVPGMSYGQHVDNALMGPPGNQVRTDVATTVFLSDPDSYGGGELELSTDLGQQRLKLAPGHAVVYPAHHLHQVREVTSGVRLAAVTWTQSMVRDPVKRSMLIELGQVIRELRQEESVERERVDRLARIRANLVRRWADT